MPAPPEPSVLLPLEPSEVFSTVAEPTTYPDWLVGCKEIRTVDAAWPEPGSRFFHRVGIAGPLTVADSTVVLDVDAPSRLTLEVRARPIGRGLATFHLEPGTSDDHPGVACTRIELVEEPLGRLRAFRSLLRPMTVARNQRSLDLLAELLSSSRRTPG